MREKLTDRTVYLDDTNPLAAVTLDVFVSDDPVVNHARVSHQEKWIAVRRVLSGNDRYWERVISTVYNRGDFL